VIQRKLLTPNDFGSLAEAETALLAFQDHYQQIAARSSGSSPRRISLTCSSAWPLTSQHPHWQPVHLYVAEIPCQSTKRARSLTAKQRVAMRQTAVCSSRAHSYSSRAHSYSSRAHS